MKPLIQYNSDSKWKNILYEAKNFQINDFLVHEDYGIGRFVGIERLLISNQLHDCIKLLYWGNDKLYVPVENISTIKYYGSNYENVALDKLGNNNIWQKKKINQKKLIYDLAKKIITKEANRKFTQTSSIQININEYNKFTAQFEHQETEDQINAIKDIEQDLRSTHLMDRLICGDVGFGKTEIAMRTAFLVINGFFPQKKQVVVICPTTLLCKQHYNNFKLRFDKFNINIVEISSSISKSELNKNKLLIKEGKADIIIGTHALLKNSIEYANLSLLIIDEEQHFGVKQKDFFKEKGNLHILSISATPIPRTLQMSLTGIKDISILATPPKNRLPIEINVQQYSINIIKEALLREHARQGQSFYICPRISDIDKTYKQLQQLLPTLKIQIAHGKVPKNELDKIMLDFFYKKYDVLVATTILESGLDISNVNTILIENAEKFGISQLYQLRGRIGRSSRKAYAYFFIDNKKLENEALAKKFDILSKSNSLGSGLMIANHDLELRGYGNLAGFDQSGHIKELGFELYQEMLKAAISEITTNKIPDKISSNINIRVAVYISEDYIKDSVFRLTLYRRIGTLNNKQDIVNFCNQVIKQFGPIPTEFQNLLSIIEIKQMCAQLYIERLDKTSKGYVIKFQDIFDINNLISSFVNKNLDKVKIVNNNTIIIKEETSDAIKDTFNILNTMNNFIKL